jgi:hypothetical protein
MRGVCDALRADEPELNPVQPGLALAVVGGVDEIVVRAIESEGVEAIAALGDIATGLWAAVLTGAVVPERARSAGAARSPGSRAAARAMPPRRA